MSKLKDWCLNLLLTILASHINKKEFFKKRKEKIPKIKKWRKKKQKKYIYQLIRTYWNSQENTKDWLRRAKIYKIKNFDPVDKENSIFEEENSKLYV